MDTAFEYLKNFNPSYCLLTKHISCIPVEPEPIVGCEDDDDCSSNEACRNQDCINPCVIPRNPCTNPATCSVSNHQPVCTCPFGYEENAYGQCTPGKDI